jgi:adenine-specific DNA-methyltransferase
MMARKTPDRVKERHHRKRLGRFYTPEPVAVAMTSWAVRSSTDRTLDPSYGGCAFLSAAASRLGLLGAPKPFRQVFGVDIDRSARRYVTTLAGAEAENGNFVSADFLATRPKGDAWRVSSVLGNPPYVRHHTMSARQSRTAQNAMTVSGTKGLPRTASYWTYFVLHSLQFLESGGRLAMVLPPAFLNAAYAARVRETLVSRFRSVRVLIVRERLFSEADEASVIVLADGFDEVHRGSSIESVDTVAEIQEACRCTVDADLNVLHADSFGWKRELLGKATQELLARLDPRAQPDVKTLGSLASVRIGTVTGANQFFVISPAEAKRLKLPPAALRPAIAATARLPPLALGPAEWGLIKAANCRSLLFAPGARSKSAAVRRYLKSSAAKKARESGHCEKREVWYRIPDMKAPDAFVPYVNDYSPRIVLNGAKVVCTNAIHRLWWNTTKTVSEETLALSALSSLTALSAEVYGRSYGGGALKLELKELRALWVATPVVDAAVVTDAFGRATLALTAGDREGATAIADDAILRRGLGLSVVDTNNLAEAVGRLRRLRVEHGQRANVPLHAASA